jgi:hypothetical protein
VGVSDGASVGFGKVVSFRCRDGISTGFRAGTDRKGATETSEGADGSLSIVGNPVGEVEYVRFKKVN